MGTCWVVTLARSGFVMFYFSTLNQCYYRVSQSGLLIIVQFVGFLSQSTLLLVSILYHIQYNMFIPLFALPFCSYPSIRMLLNGCAYFYIVWYVDVS